jgi:hypothetical protein
MHFLSLQVRRRRHGRWRTGGVAGSNSGLLKRAIAKSARAPVPAVQNFRPRPSWQAAAHFGVYFCRNIWDRLRRIAGQVGGLPIPQAKTVNGVWGVFRSAVAAAAGAASTTISISLAVSDPWRPIRTTPDALADECIESAFFVCQKREKDINETKKMQYGGDLVGFLGSMWL